MHRYAAGFFGFYPDLFLQKSGGYSPFHAFYILLHVYINEGWPSRYARSPRGGAHIRSEHIG